MNEEMNGQLDQILNSFIEENFEDTNIDQI